MGERALWPTVAVVLIVCTMLTVMLWIGVEPVTLLAVLSTMFTGIGSLIGVLLYGKMVKVESNTNGSITKQQELVKELISRLALQTPPQNGV